MRLPKPKRPQHCYNPHELFTRTAAYDVFYKTTIMPLLGRASRLPREKAYHLYRLKVLQQVDRLNGRWAKFDGVDRLLNMKMMLDCPVPGCLPYPRSVWSCRNRYVCPSCYGLEMIRAYNEIAPMIDQAAETGHQIFAATQTFPWPSDPDREALANYLTRYVHAVSLYVQRFVPAGEVWGKIKDMPFEPVRGVARMFVWPDEDPVDKSPVSYVRFGFVGLRQPMPEGMTLMQKWPMARQLQDTIWNGPPDDLVFGRPNRHNLVNALTRSFRYPVKLFTAKADRVAAVLNTVTNKRLRMVRYVGLSAKGEYDVSDDF